MAQNAGTTPTTDTVLDRYIRIFDRTAHDPEVVEELQSIFAPDATVQLTEDSEPVTGLSAIMAVYRNITAQMADSQHFWTVTELDDGTLECHWVQAGRATDGRLVSMSGIEHATVNADGLVTHLANRMVPTVGW